MRLLKVVLEYSGVERGQVTGFTPKRLRVAARVGLMKSSKLVERNSELTENRQLRAAEQVVDGRYGDGVADGTCERGVHADEGIDAVSMTLCTECHEKSTRVSVVEALLHLQ